VQQTFTKGRVGIAPSPDRRASVPIGNISQDRPHLQQVYNADVDCHAGQAGDDVRDIAGVHGAGRHWNHSAAWPVEPSKLSRGFMGIHVGGLTVA